MIFGPVIVIVWASQRIRPSCSQSGPFRSGPVGVQSVNKISCLCNDPNKSPSDKVTALISY